MNIRVAAAAAAEGTTTNRKRSRERTAYIPLYGHCLPPRGGHWKEKETKKKGGRGMRKGRNIYKDRLSTRARAQTRLKIKVKKKLLRCFFLFFGLPFFLCSWVATASWDSKGKSISPGELRQVLEILFMRVRHCQLNEQNFFECLSYT